MPSRAANIIDELYGKELKSSKWQGALKVLMPGRRRAKPGLYMRVQDKRVVDLYRERNKMLTRARILILSAALLGAFIFGISIYYFNVLTRNEQDVFKEKAKIDSLLQRRRNLSVNLAKSVRDYAIHEQGIFNHVSQMRASEVSKDKGTGQEAIKAGAGASAGGVLDEVLSLLEGSPAGGISISDKLSGLMAVAESYPDLKLSDNFQRFMEALIETEKDLSDERMKYSEIVNNYTTQLRTLPGKFFAVLYGFEQLPYYRADSEARGFSPIEY